MTPDDPWLAGVWPFVRAELPPTPATVLEIGCGSLGGFVPALLDAGDHAVGVDPEAPEGPDYQRSRSNTTSRSTRWTAWWRRCRCITWSSWMRPWTSFRRCWCLAACWWWWSGPGSDSTRPRPAGASPGWHHRPQGTSLAGCTGTRSDGLPPGSPGTATFGSGPNEEGLHPGEEILRGWMRVRPPVLMPRARTSSPTSPIRARPKSRPPSTPARSGRAASGTPPRGPDLPAACRTRTRPGDMARWPERSPASG